MNWNNLIRRTHRALSVIFTVTVIINFVAFGLGTEAVWVGLLALPPLALLLLSGLYLFVLPYAVRWRSARRTD